MNQLEDEYIIEQILAGKKEQYALLVNRYKQLVVQITFKILQNQVDAEECAQESFIKAFKYLASFKGDSSFSTWLYRVAYNTALTQKAKLKKRQWVDIEGKEDHNDALEFEPSSYGDSKHEEQKKFLKQAMQQLNEEEQSLIQFFYLQELSLQEISEITQQSTNYLKVKIHRTRAKMKKQLDSILKDETLSLL